MCLIDEANAPSRALAAKLGYQEFDQARYHGCDVLLLERLAA